MLRIDEAMVSLKPGEHLNDVLPCPDCGGDETDWYCDTCRDTGTVTRAQMIEWQRGHAVADAVWAERARREARR